MHKVSEPSFILLELVLEPNDHRRMANLSGHLDEHLRQIEKALNIKIKNRGNRFQLKGPEDSTEVGRQVLKDLFQT